MWRYTNTEIKEKTWEKVIKRYPKMQRRSDIAIACMWQHTRNLGEIVPVNVHCPLSEKRTSATCETCRCTLWELFFSKREMD